MKLYELQLYQEYDYSAIEKIADANNYEMNECGIGDTIGKCVIILDHREKDSNLVFVMTSRTDYVTYYRLCYSDATN